MPSGAKKRKALKKKKKELEAFGASPSNKSLTGHGYDEHGSQDEGESDGNLSSPGSQGNGEFWTRDPSPSPLSGLKKDTVKEKTDVPQGQEAKREDLNGMDGSIPVSAAETSKDVKIVKESQVPEFSEEKSVLPSGPPVVRTSWLSCCGLFDLMSGSGR